MKKWAIGGGILLVVVVTIVIIASWKRPSKPPEPPKVERPTGPDPALVAKIADVLKRTEELEAQGRYSEAIKLLGQLAALEPNHPRLAPLRTRLEEKRSRLEAWRRAQTLAEEARSDAVRRNTLADWQKLVAACEEAQKHAPAEEQQRLTRELAAVGLQGRDWAAAREEERKGNFAAALDLATQAMAAREPSPELAAFKKALEQKKRKQEFDRIAFTARGETNPARALEFWNQARTLADNPKDIEDVERKIDDLRPRVDPAERDRRYEAAMKAGEAAFAAGRLDEAEKAFRVARALKSTDALAGQGLARVEAAQKLKAYETAMAQARECEGRKDWGKALEAYDRALRTKPLDSAATAGRKEIEEVRRPAKIEIVPGEDPAVKMEFILIKPGTFRRGDAQGRSDEKPHEVAITRDYWIQTTEVTQGQWDLVMRTKPWSFSSTPILPVEGVSWDDAQKFLEKLNAPAQARLKGRKASLPTEAEWEYACRAGTTTPWNFGQDESELERYAWYARNSARSPQPVGKKLPNAWGLYDMHGNVAEWCEDGYGAYPEKAADPTGAESGPFRCLRGGSWNDRAAACRSGNREKSVPNTPSMFVGFRVVLR